MLERQHGTIIFCCDACGDTLETGEREFAPAKAVLDAEGWRARKFGVDWMHYCAGCRDG